MVSRGQVSNPKTMEPRHNRHSARSKPLRLRGLPRHALRKQPHHPPRFKSAGLTTVGSIIFSRFPSWKPIVGDPKGRLGRDTSA